MAGNGLVTSQDPDHAKHRGLIKRHFEFSQLKAVFPVFVRTAHRLADHWAAEWAGKDKQLDVIAAMSKAAAEEELLEVSGAWLLHPWL